MMEGVQKWVDSGLLSVSKVVSTLGATNHLSASLTLLLTTLDPLSYRSRDRLRLPVVSGALTVMSKSSAVVIS